MRCLDGITNSMDMLLLLLLLSRFSRVRLCVFRIWLIPNTKLLLLLLSRINRVQLCATP